MSCDKCCDGVLCYAVLQAADLMKEWAAIDIADALELLSPDFKNHEVRAHAVATLQVRTPCTNTCTCTWVTWGNTASFG